VFQELLPLFIIDGDVIPFQLVSRHGVAWPWEWLHILGLKESNTAGIPLAIDNLQPAEIVGECRIDRGQPEHDVEGHRFGGLELFRGPGLQLHTGHHPFRRGSGTDQKEREET